MWDEADPSSRAAARRTEGKPAEIWEALIPRCAVLRYPARDMLVQVLSCR